MNTSTLLSIKEFSDFTGIKQSTLRYYDEIALLPSVARGKNNSRYYTPLQIITLNFINVLIDLDVQLSIIKECDKSRTPEKILDLLARQEYELDFQLHKLQTAYSVIHTYRDNIQAGLLAHDNDISIRTMDETSIILGNVNDYSGGGSFYKPFIEFCNSADEHGINLSYPIGGYHDDMSTFLDAPSDPVRFFSQDPRGKHKRKAGQYLVAHKQGFYGEFEDLPQRLASYAQMHGLVFNGPVYITYLLDEISMTDPHQYLAQFMVGVSHNR